MADPGDAVFEPDDPFEVATGPFRYRREADGSMVFALAIEARHCNKDGAAHGGVLLNGIAVIKQVRARG